MCSIDNSQILPLQEDFSGKKNVSKCFKCGGAAVTVARGQDPFCQVCFCAYFRQKFRTTLGKLRVIRPGDKIMLAYSGGASSGVLLRLLTDVLKDHSARKVPTTVVAAFIDDGGVTSRSREDRCSTAIELLSAVASVGVACTLVPMEAAYMDSLQLYPQNELLVEGSDKEISVEKVTSAMSKAEEATTQLHASLDNFVSLSARQSFVRILRQRILLRVAKELKLSKVFVGDNATKVSADLISNIAQGRGAALPLDTGFVDDHYQCTSFIRPLREFQLREILDFATFNDILTTSSSAAQSISSVVSGNSIDGLTGTFIEELQAKFPSTVNTIFRTGEKLGVPAHKSESVCQLCMAPTFRPREDLVFSHISQETMDTDIKLEMLCYGCCLIVKDMRVRDKKFLPASAD